MVDEITRDIGLGAIGVTVVTLLIALITWPNPLTVAVITGIIGGLVTSPFFVYLGYILSERKNSERAETAKRVTQAKAAISFNLFYVLARSAAIAIPEAPAKVKSPSTQLRFNTQSIFEFVPLQVLTQADVDLPEDLRREAIAPIALAGELASLIRLSRQRTYAITRQDSTEGEGPTDWRREWRTEDTSDSEFTQLYALALEKRSQLIDAIDIVLPKVASLTKAVEGG